MAVTTSTSTVPADGKVVFSNSGAAASFSNGYLTEDGNLSDITFDVLAASGGGAKTTIWSVDDGDNDGENPNVVLNKGFTGYNTDLLSKDAIGARSTTANGGQFWIGGDGMIHYDASGVGDINNLAVGSSFTDTFTYTIRMANGTLSIGTLTVNIVNSEDAVVITSSAQSGSVTEDTDGSANENNEVHTQTGSIIYTDADTLDTHTAGFVANVDNTTNYGTFSLNTDNIDTGHGGTVGWTFSVDDSAIDELQEGEHVVQKYDVTIDDGHAGGARTETVTIDIYGKNDVATFSGDNTGAVTEDGTTTTGGTLGTHDDDHDETGFQPVTTGLAGTYGDFTFDEGTGDWTYTLRNGDSNVQALGADDHPTDTLTVMSLDGTTKDIIVTVNGADEPVVTPTDLGAPTGIAFVPTADGNSTSPIGHFVATGDPDGSDTYSWAISTTSGGSGVTIGANGELNSPNTGSYVLHVTVTDPDAPGTQTASADFNLILGANGSSNDLLNPGAAPNSNIEYGLNGSDTINGSAQVDYLLGGAQDDRLVGNGQADVLLGGGGHDTFVYLATGDSTPAAADSILGFDVTGGSSDKIDLSGVDANENAGGNQAFSSLAFSSTVTANSVNYYYNGADTVLQADTNGDSTADLQITVVGVHATFDSSSGGNIVL